MNKIVKGNLRILKFSKGLYFMAEGFQEENEHFHNSIVLQYGNLGFLISVKTKLPDSLCVKISSFCSKQTI